MLVWGGWWTPPPAAWPPWQNPDTHCTREAEWALWHFWTGMEQRKHLDPSEIRSPDRPAHSKSLYILRQSCPTSVVLVWWFKRYFSYLSRDVFAVLTSVTTYSKLKVKCTLVQALRLCTGRTAHKGSSGIALPFHERSARSEWGVSVTPRLLFTPVKEPVPIVQEAGWAPGPVWTGAENLGPTGIRSPDRPCRSQSLYRLSYPALYNV